MDKLLRPNKRFGESTARAFFSGKILNKSGDIIGMRFNFCHNIFIDIPIQNIYVQDDIGQKTLSSSIDTMLETRHTFTFNFFKGTCINLHFDERYVDLYPTVLNDDFSYETDLDELTSIYMPKCIIRYFNINFRTLGAKNLVNAMNLIYSDDFKRIFKPSGIEHLRFFDNHGNITVHINTMLPKDIDYEEFENLYDLYCSLHGGYSCRKVLDLYYDSKEHLLVLTVHSNTKLNIEDSSFKIDEKSFSIRDEKHRHRYVFKSQDQFFIVPDGGSNMFNIETPFVNKELSDDTRALLSCCSRGDINVDYHFVDAGNHNLYLYIGMSPYVKPIFYSVLNNDIDGALESEKMELFQNIVSDGFEYLTECIVKNGNVACRLTKKYNIDPTFFGSKKASEKNLLKIMDAYKKMLGDRADVEYDESGHLLFSMSANIYDQDNS